MRKNYIYFIVLFILSISVSAQKVTLTPANVNNIGYTGGPINLGGVAFSSVSLSVTVELPDNVAVGDTGTIRIYCSNGTALGVNVASGGDGGSLYFGGGKVATKSFYINLNWSDFSTSFAYLFAEYKNPAGTSFKSSNISIIKNATLNGGTVNAPADAPNPNKITNTICCNQTIRQGEKPAPITGSQYSNPYFDKIYGINSAWSAYALLQLDNANQVLYLDYYDTTVKSHTIQRRLGYNGTSDFPNKSNIVTITVVPSPLTANEITINGSINTDGSIEINNNNPKEIFGDSPSINLNVLQNPYSTPQRADTYSTIEKFEWEYYIINGTREEATWKTIPNQISASLNSSYLPRIDINKDNLYSVRRIAIYQNLKLASNTLKILLRAVRDNNTICCDQILEVSSSNVIEKPSIITGTTTISDKNTYLSYQWQNQTVNERDLKVGNWTNIPKATSKDYSPPTPEFIPGNGRNRPTIPTYNYRRIATDNSYIGETYYSNEISLKPSTSVYNFSLPLLVHPNPATSIINIEDTRVRKMAGDILLADLSINIVNILGNVVNSNNFSLVTPDLISINISNLAGGLYFINVSSSKGRGHFQQFTFIKQ